MSRVDKPTLKCDRCGEQTESLPYMGKYRRLDHYHMIGKGAWDLCPPCWVDFIAFIKCEEETDGPL